jgi:hypothetical protein
MGGGFEQAPDVSSWQQQSLIPAGVHRGSKTRCTRRVRGGGGGGAVGPPPFSELLRLRLGSLQIGKPRTREHTTCRSEKNGGLMTADSRD